VDNSHLLEGDVADAVATLKSDSGPEIQVHGSANLLQTLIEHDLIDEYQLMIFPVLLGNGKRLFDDGTIPSGRKLVDSKASGTGVVIATYEGAGDVEQGEFAFEQPADEEIERRRNL